MDKPAKESDAVILNNSSLSDVICQPGKEPERIRRRLDRLFEKLDIAYPDKVVRSLHKNNKKIGETVTELYRLLGYPNGTSFLNAYGYTVSSDAHGRPTNNAGEIVAELKRRYPNGAACSKMADLHKDNPDLSSKLRTLSNQADKLFGMTLAKYFIQQGILVGKTEAQHDLEFEKLKCRYADKPFEGAINELQTANPDIDWTSINKYHMLSGSPDSFKLFLKNAGIITERKISVEEKLSALTAELKKRYPESKKFSGTLNKLGSVNNDLPLSCLNAWTKQVYQISATDYLVQQGIMEKDLSINEKELSINEKLASITEALKERYSGKKKAFSIDQLIEENPDLPIAIIRIWTRKVYGQSVTAYLNKLGILSPPSNADCAAHQNSAIAMEMATSPESKYYTAPVYTVAKIDITGDEASNWEYYECTPPDNGQIVLKDYIGSNPHIILPTSINGKKVNRIAERGFSKCRAQIVEIPGTYGFVTQWAFLGNKHLQKLIVGEGVAEIETGAFSSIPTLEDVLASQSVEMIGPYATFHDSKWFRKQNGDVIVGKVYVGYTGRSSVINIPHGVKTIAACDFPHVRHGVQKIIIPGTVTTLCEGAFDSFAVKDVEEFVFTDSITSIGHNAFGSENKWLRHFKDGLVIINRQLYKYLGKNDALDIPEGVHKICDYAFSEHKELTYVHAPSTLREIGEGAFEKCRSLTTVDLVDGVQRIWKDCFRGCEKLSKIRLPDTLTDIGDGAFKICRSLTVVDLPDGVQHIGELCFYGCEKLSKILLPETLTDMGESAFEDCRNLTAIHLPSGLQHIGKMGFCGCEKLSEISIPNSLQEIGYETFYKCSSLEKVSFGNNLETIGAGAFRECVKLRSVELTARITSILSGAFYGCTALCEANLSDGLKKIGKEAFKNCDSLQKIIMHDGLEEIGVSAFENCKALQEFDLPQNVGDNAFANCRSLKRVSFSDGMATISKKTFLKCSSLEQAIIPVSVEVIEKSAFEGCSALSIVMLPTKLKTIDCYAFCGCTNIEMVSIPRSVEVIGENAFKDCTKLSSVVGVEFVSELGTDAFTNTPHLKKSGKFAVIKGVLVKYLGDDIDVVIPANVKAIGKNAFAEAPHVESIVIPENVKTIEERMMGGSFGREDKPLRLKRVVIGNGVTSIGRSAFADCKELTEVVFGSSLKKIEPYAFCGCSKLKAVDLSNTKITTIQQGVFEWCGNIMELNLPPDIQTIESHAFAQTGLKKIKLQKSLKTVKDSAFYRTSELIVYDTIDPDAVDAKDWENRSRRSPINSELSVAMLNVVSLSGVSFWATKWADYHITVLSSETGKIRYRIFCDSNERMAYRKMMFKAWGKHASFTFEAYDDFFMRTHNPAGRTEMAFCRIMYPEGLSSTHRVNYEAFLERCLYIERSAKRTAEIIAREDSVDRLRILSKYNSIDSHNTAWIREQFERYNAEKCIAFLNSLNI